MKNNTLVKSICVALFVLASANSAASELKMSVGGGWPFILVPQVSYQDGDVNYYVNYKLGVDDGFTLGAEREFGKHRFGGFIGAIGARKTDQICDSTIGCLFDGILFSDHQTTQGIGVSYEYRFSTDTSSGWAIRLESGYGKESRTDTKRVDGNVQVLYHF